MRISLIWIFNIDLLDVDVLKGTELPPPPPPHPSTPTYTHFHLTHPQTLTIKQKK